MTESKHTPGPWKLDWNPDNDGQFMILEQDDYIVITGHGPRGISKTARNNLANARLIAAAPDMALMLWALVNGWYCDRATLYDSDAVEGYIRTAPNGTNYYALGDWDELPEMPDELRAAIAKARGEE